MTKTDTVIVVGQRRMDEYNNLWITPAGGGDEVKIGEKRSHLHELFEQGRAILLHWETYKNRPYVSDAKPVEGELPPPTEPKMLPKHQAVVAKAVAEATKPAPQEIGMWFKHKAFTLSYAKDLACNGVIEIKDLYKYAEEMLDWLNKPMV